MSDAVCHGRGCRTSTMLCDVAGLVAAPARYLAFETPLFPTAPAPVCASPLAASGAAAPGVDPGQDPHLRDEIIAYVSEPRPVAEIAVHIERSVPITTGHLPAMIRRGLMKRLGYPRIPFPAMCAPASASMSRFSASRSEIHENMPRHSHFWSIAFSTMEANMARLISQLGAPAVVAFRAPRQLSRRDLPARAAALTGVVGNTPEAVQAGLPPWRQNTGPVVGRV